MEYLHQTTPASLTSREDRLWEALEPRENREKGQKRNKKKTLPSEWLRLARLSRATNAA